MPSSEAKVTFPSYLQAFIDDFIIIGQNIAGRDLITNHRGYI